MPGCPRASSPAARCTSVNGERRTDERERVDHHFAELRGIIAEDVVAEETLHLQVLDNVKVHVGDDLDAGFVARWEESGNATCVSSPRR